MTASLHAVELYAVQPFDEPAKIDDSERRDAIYAIENGLAGVNLDEETRKRIRMHRFTAGQQRAFEKGQQEPEIAEPIFTPEGGVHVDLYTDLAFAYAQGMITAEQRDNMQRNPHAEGLDVIRKAVEERRELEKRWPMERRRALLDVAHVFNLVGTEQKKELLNGRVKGITSHPWLVANDLDHLDAAVQHAMQARDAHDREHVDLGTSSKSLFDGAVTQNVLGGKSSKMIGAFYQIPGKALRLFWETVDNTPFLIESFDQHLAYAKDAITEILEDHDSTQFLGLAMMHLATALCVGKNAPFAHRVESKPGTLGLVRVAQVMERGARNYGRGNWRRVEFWSQIDHAIQHVIAFDANDESAYKPEYGFVNDKVECNLWNALCRLMMAVEVFDPEYRFTDDT